VLFLGDIRVGWFVDVTVEAPDVRKRRPLWDSFARGEPSAFKAGGAGRDWPS